MSATRRQRASRTLPALAVLLAVVWLAGVATPAPGNGPAAPATTATSADSRAATVRQHQVAGGLVTDRRDKPGRYSLVLLGIQAGALATVLLVAAGSRSPAALRPRRRTRPALVDARAPPSLRLA